MSEDDGRAVLIHLTVNHDLMFDNLFKFLGAWYPFRWFIVIAGMLLMSMSYMDYTGWRFLSAGGSSGPAGAGGGHYYGSGVYHK